MKLQTTRTARFTEVVAKCGEPEAVSLWTEPHKNKRFMSAVRQNRVMTIKQENVGAKKDFGIVGFIEEKNVSYLIFPKTLRAFENHRIVGIKYNLVKSEAPLGRKIESARGEETAARSKRLMRAEAFPERPADFQASPAHKKLKQFKVVVRFTATADISQEIEAESKAEAREKADEISAPDLSGATVTRKLVRVTES